MLFFNRTKNQALECPARIGAFAAAAGVVVVLAGCGMPPQSSADKPSRNDFPTQARVEFVLQCMQKKGAQNYDTLYPCVCSIDKIAEQLSYEEYSEAQTFTYLRTTPGEKGAIFRDPPRSKDLRGRLKEAIAYAEQSCFVK